MTAVSFYRRGLLILGITMLLVFPLNGQQQTTTALSEIFLLDLGIVIEPSTGEESYNRRVESPSKEVNIRIKQIKSGTVYSVATQELLTAIERINTRISALEKSFHSELIALKYENKELQQLLASARPVLEKPNLPYISFTTVEPQIIDDAHPVDLPIVKSIVVIPPDPYYGFDNKKYLKGMYAYQCENFSKALKCFDNLDLKTADMKTIENVLYWTADAYLHVHDYDQALATLDELLEYPKSDMADDALVKKGLLYKELGNMDLAMNSFKKVVVGHPDSEYSRLAALEIKRGELALQ